MITTIDTLLKSLSYRLNESTTEYTPQRYEFANDAIRHVFGQYSWSFRRKHFDLSTTIGTQNYDLTDSSILTDDDYDPEFGIYEVWNGSTKLDPVDFDNVDNFSSADCYTLSPDTNEIIFTLSQSSSNTYTIYYYATHKDVANKDTVLNVSIPNNFKIPIVTYMKHLVHESKRQRNDSRNMLLDFEEQMSDVRMSQGKSKAKGLKQNIPTPTQYSKFKRKYDF